VNSWFSTPLLVSLEVVDVGVWSMEFLEKFRARFRAVSSNTPGDHAIHLLLVRSGIDIIEERRSIYKNRLTAAF
jgi:hypothetical protein